VYEKFYGFTHKPFNTTPDSRFFFPSQKHAEALNSLIYAITERRGFVVITGEIGAGKTTVWRTLLNKLPANTKVATITNTHLTCQDLIIEILEELQVTYTPGSKQRLIAQLNTYLIDQLASDNNVVLVIDEAQNLSAKVLEEVRMLSNLETEQEKLIQIILMGQPQLRAKLAGNRLEQFRQRIAVNFHLTALSREETWDYMNHRLKLVGSNGHVVFGTDTLDLIYSYSAGVPRIVNIICDGALLTGYVYEAKTITPEIISEVVKEKELPNKLEEEQKRKDRKNKRAKIYCCSDCNDYYNCITKWERGIRGEEQLCCETCKSYDKCMQQRMNDADL
jgi:general secretion pathway protein A